RGHFARECRAPRSQGTINIDNTRRVVPVKNPTNALVVTDGMGYDWSYQAEEGPTDFARMAFSSLGSSSSDTEIFIVQLYTIRLISKEGEHNIISIASYTFKLLYKSSMLNVSMSDLFRMIRQLRGVFVWLPTVRGCLVELPRQAAAYRGCLVELPRQAAAYRGRLVELPRQAAAYRGRLFKLPTAAA
nr:hypothetical protein [Tanacetum cinerariifolium]